MEGLVNDVNYHPINLCDSDDSQSNASQSEENEVVPGMRYASDDSAEVIQSDSTYIDSDTPNYIAQNVDQKMEDELSQQLLIESDSAVSPQPSQQGVPMKTNMGEKTGNLQQPKVFHDRPKIHLQVNPVAESAALTRSQSMSSSSTEADFGNQVPFLPQYEQLSTYSDDGGRESPVGKLSFDSIVEDPVKMKAMHEQLSSLATSKEVEPSTGPLKGNLGRFFVGDVPIDARYRDSFLVKWNWAGIRQSCVVVNLSLLFAFLCIGVGLVVQMPKGSDCDPPREWWQGSANYYVFVPSFQDSNGDGYGDLSGLVSRLDYIQNLGFAAVRLVPIFDTNSHVGDKVIPKNYTAVSPVLGDMKDLRLLTALLHERNMYLFLDVPLVDKGVATVDFETEIPEILNHWLTYGVDGFAFTDLQELNRVDEDLVRSLRKWKHLLGLRSRPMKKRVMSVSGEFVEMLEKERPEMLHAVLSSVDLIDVVLDPNLSVDDMSETIRNATEWDDHASLPWISWRVGGPFEPRVSDVGSSLDEGVSFSLLPLFLPGSVTIYYGEEIGLAARHQDQEYASMSWATPMAWDNDGGFTEGHPWAPTGLGLSERNVISRNESLTTLRVMVIASQKEVPLYINGIFEDVGSYSPVKSTNYKIRGAGEDLLIIDRFFPRRNKFAFVLNLSRDFAERDLSRLFYGGRVVASSHGKTGYVRFHRIAFEPHEVLVVALDK